MNDDILSSSWENVCFPHLEYTERRGSNASSVSFDSAATLATLKSPPTPSSHIDFAFNVDAYETLDDTLHSFTDTTRGSSYCAFTTVPSCDREIVSSQAWAIGPFPGTEQAIRYPALKPSPLPNVCRSDEVGDAEFRLVQSNLLTSDYIVPNFSENKLDFASTSRHANSGLEWSTESLLQSQDLRISQSECEYTPQCLDSPTYDKTLRPHFGWSAQVGCEDVSVEELDQCQDVTEADQMESPFTPRLHCSFVKHESTTPSPLSSPLGSYETKPFESRPASRHSCRSVKPHSSGSLKHIPVTVVLAKEAPVHECGAMIVGVSKGAVPINAELRENGRWHCLQKFHKKEHLTRHLGSDRHKIRNPDTTIWCPVFECKKSEAWWRAEHSCPIEHPPGFGDRADNLRDHVEKTHCSSECTASRNGRLSEAQAEEYGFGDLFRKQRRKEAEERLVEELRKIIHGDEEDLYNSSKTTKSRNRSAPAYKKRQMAPVRFCRELACRVLRFFEKMGVVWNEKKLRKNIRCPQLERLIIDDYHKRGVWEQRSLDEDREEAATRRRKKMSSAAAARRSSMRRPPMSQALTGSVS